MEDIKVRQRSEIPVEDTWALEDLYATDAAWEEDLLEYDEDRKALMALEGQLGASAANLFAYLDRMEVMWVRSDRLGNYCNRKADQDTRDSESLSMKGRFQTAGVNIDAACSFETPEIMAIPQDTLESYYQEEPRLERYRRFLTDVRRRRAHALSPAEEKLLAAAGEMSQTPYYIYGAFSNADIKFPDALDSEGKPHTLTRGTFVPTQMSDDRVLRKNAYENFYHTWADFRNTTAATLNGQGKKLKFFADARKYPSALEAALDRNNVPTSVYLNLIDTVHKNMDKMHRYVRLRKKMLGVDELHFYDVYTPLLPNMVKNIPIEEAKQTVYDALEVLGDDYRRILKEGFENRWIDIYENVGKRSGAYSAGARVHPYVLLNYSGNLDSQFTLAHEMGHALHSYLSEKTQNPIDADYVIFVAEVASTCNEALLMEYLLEKNTDRKERIFLINHFLEQFKSTLYRQTMFAEFEMIIGNMIGEGKTLTADILCREYKKLNELYFGPDMVVDDEIAMEWARIPHFYYNYYVFQYATGYSAAITLSRKILSGGEAARDAYLEFLSGGCSKSPIDLLKGAGVDMTTPEPVDKALELFGELLDEMEKLIEE